MRESYPITDALANSAQTRGWSHLEALPSQKYREKDGWLSWGRCAPRINEIDRLLGVDRSFDQVLLTPDPARVPKSDLNPRWLAGLSIRLTERMLLSTLSPRVL